LLSFCSADYFGRPTSVPERVEHRAGHDQRGVQRSRGQQHGGRGSDDDGRGQHGGQRDRRRRIGVHHAGPEDSRPNAGQAVGPQLSRSAPAVQLRASVRNQGRLLSILYFAVVVCLSFSARRLWVCGCTTVVHRHGRKHCNCWGVATIESFKMSKTNASCWLLSHYNRSVGQA